MKKVACFLFFVGVVLPYGYACLINSALSKSYLIGAAITAVALGLVTFLAYRKDKTARWEKVNKKAEAERIAREKAEEEARKKAEAERIAREKAEEKARKKAEEEQFIRERLEWVEAQKIAAKQRVNTIIENFTREKNATEKRARETAVREQAKAEQIARKKADHEAKVAQFNVSSRQELTDLEAAFQKAQEEEVAVIAALKAL